MNIRGTQQIIAITGGCGFMGRHLARHLLAKGHAIRLLDLAAPPDDVPGSGAQWIKGSMLDPLALELAFADAHAVVHLAAKVSDYGTAQDFERLNVQGTQAVIDACHKYGVTRLVHMSSLAVFDYRRGLVHATEDTPAGGHEYVYGQTKYRAEQSVQAAHAVNGLQTVVVRPGLVPFGPEDLNSTVGFFDAILQAMPLLVAGGTNKIGISYIDNLVAGLDLCIHHPAAAGETFHLCDDADLTMRAFLEALASVTGRSINARSVPYPVAMAAATVVESISSALRIRSAPAITRYRIRTATSDLHLSNQKAKRILGYHPIVTLDDAVKQSYQWYTSHKGK